MKNKILNLILILEDWISKKIIFFDKEMISSLFEVKEENSLISFYNWFEGHIHEFTFGEGGLDDLKEFNTFLRELYKLDKELLKIYYYSFIRDLISYNLYIDGYSSHNLKQQLENNNCYDILLVMQDDIDSVSKNIDHLKHSDSIKIKFDIEY
jgi:hypothetical protein